MVEPEIKARPAEPLLASELVSDEELDVLMQDVLSVGGPRKRKRCGAVVRSGVSSVDAMLEVGLWRAANGDGDGVVGVSGEGADLCLAFLTSSLLERPHSMAAVIDTAGNFDVWKLYGLILARLKSDEEVLARQKDGDGDGRAGVGGIEDVAGRVLDRVKIMRVFDLVGVQEAVGELREGFEGRNRAEVGVSGVEEEREVITERKKSVGKESLLRKTVITETETIAEPEKSVAEEVLPRKTVIADSEDEEDDEEILFESEVIDPRPPSPQPQHPVTHPVSEAAPVAAQSTPAENHNVCDEPKLDFILIDNLAHVLSPLLKKDYIQANALASTFLRTLASLTHTHSLLTLLLNPSSIPKPPPPPKPALPRSNPNQAAPPPQQHQHQTQPPPPPSIFASNRSVPALSHILPTYLDLHLLVSKMPHRKADARIVYAGDGRSVPATRTMKRGVHMVGVVEVLADRWGSRVGDWGTFGERDEGGIGDV